jgi:hypothetical protein
MRAPLDLLVQAFEHVGALHMLDMLVVRQRQPVIGQCLFDVSSMLSSTQVQSLAYLPCHFASRWASEPGVARNPAAPRSGDKPPGLESPANEARSRLTEAKIAAIVHKAQLLAAIVIHFTRHVVERILQEAYVAALLERFPITWNHVIEKESLKFKEVEHVLMRHRIYPMSQYRKSRATFSGLASR